MKRRIGLAMLAAVALLALAADLLAANLPLYCRLDGRAYFLPCLTRPAALVGQDQQSLARSGSVLVRTPIPYGPLAQRPGGELRPLEAPSRAHLLGTDDRGRDVAARLIHGARVACLVGPLAVLAYLCFGVFVGALCASSHGIDLVLSRVIEAGLAIPPLLLLLAVQGISGRGSVVAVAFVIALAEWPQAARLVRAEALRVAASEHVLAARAIGARRLRVALRHILPLSLGPADRARGLRPGPGRALRERAQLSRLRNRAAFSVVGRVAGAGLCASLWLAARAPIAGDCMDGAGRAAARRAGCASNLSSGQNRLPVKRYRVGAGS